MAGPSPGHSITVRMEIPSSVRATGELVAAVTEAGGSLTALDVAESNPDGLVVDVGCDASDADHADLIAEALDRVEGVTDGSAVPGLGNLGPAVKAIAPVYGAGSHDITEAVMLAASSAIADSVSASELNASYLVPSVFDPHVATAVADAVREAATAG